MPVTKEHMQALYHQVCAAKDVKSIAALLQADIWQLLKMRLDKPYYVFEVQSNKGKKRLIETPHKDFKIILRKLNDHLQSAYFFCRTPAAYGFVQQPRNANKKRNILSNAKLHCGKKYLLNIDLKDFFHQVSRMRVISIFKSPPFNYTMELSEFLGELTTYQNRLPMGSPTSPALSNFASMDLDMELLAYSQQQGFRYSRYVDDLSFSSNQPISLTQYYGFQDIIGKKGFTINMEKIKWMNEPDEKIVTGLILKEKPEVSPEFIADLETNIERYKHVLEFSAVAKRKNQDEWTQQFREYFLGKLRFLQMVYGYQHPVVKRINKLYYEAYNTRSFVESFNWSNFPY